MNRIFPHFLSVSLLLILHVFLLRAQTFPGIDVLVNENFAVIKGKRVGLVINQTAVRRDFRQTTLDAFLATAQCKVVALFAPEHGIDGAVLAGDDVATQIEPKSGLMVYSLYGATRKPTPQMLKGIDVMVYDIQDIGVRSYTFISTMINVMEGCAEAHIPLVILDRPNPLGGETVDGPVLDAQFKSFVGILPVPYVYGMTAGEIATMANGEGWLAGGKKCILTVERMSGWKRSMTWKQTGLEWIPSSPHIPTPDAAFGNAMTGAIGELGVASIGVGYTLPFQLIGAPWLDAKLFGNYLNEKGIQGVFFRPMVYKPFYGMSANVVCNGVQLIQTSASAMPLSAMVTILAGLRDLYPDKKLLEGVSREKWEMFNKVCGTDALQHSLLSGERAEDIIKGWQPALHKFISKRENYLLYE